MLHTSPDDVEEEEDVVNDDVDVVNDDVDVDVVNDDVDVNVVNDVVVNDDDEYLTLTPSQLITVLARENTPILSYREFEEIIKNLFENMDSDKIPTLFSEYKKERTTACAWAEKFLISLIDGGTIAPNKARSQLFRLTAFRDRQYLVNRNKIYAYYKRKNPNTQPLVKEDPTKPPKPPKPKIDLSSAKAYIYDNLIKVNREFLNINDFTIFVLDNLPQFSAKINHLYTQYKKEFNRYYKHDPIIPAITSDLTLPFPFRSKFADHDEGVKKGIFPDVKFKFEPLDKQPKKLKKELSRPSFAPNPYSWEIDHLQLNKECVTYLFCLNINTRYLYVIAVNNKSTQETRNAIKTLINKERTNFRHPVKNIRGDGDKGFGSIKAYFPSINFYFTSSKFTYHNKLVDSVMRTLRNALNDDSLWDGNHDEIIQQLVYYYNFSTHKGIKMKPIDMHTDVNKEWEYIRAKTEELNDVKREQMNKGFLNYKPGDKLRLHLEYAKTNESFAKRRRQFDRTGTFIEYINGNCKVKLDKPLVSSTGAKISVVEVPIYYTLRF